ncbi:MAG: ribonuclease HII [Candidatus Micrarchaeia archaeon]|jgi:ribonuclease HII
MDYVIGCDEAGRGCVLGALVMAAFAVPKECELELKAAGAKDSKELSASKREELAKTLGSMGKYMTRHISAAEINTAMMRKKSLNELEAEVIAELLDAFVLSLQKNGSSINTIYVDSPDPIPKKYEQRIRKHAKNLAKIKIISDNHSENKYPCVAAASIMAKTERDAELEKIHKIFKGEDIGCGYTHDKVTIEFVRKHLHDALLAPYLRTQWKTVKNMQTVQIDLNNFF